MKTENYNAWKIKTEKSFYNINYWLLQKAENWKNCKKNSQKDYKQMRVIPCTWEKTYGIGRLNNSKNMQKKIIAD